MVLCHELAHFRRGDSLLLPLICVLRILYWWHPLVWLAIARLRRERESACDDLVLNHDFRATAYADLIISTARQIQTLRWQGGALAMASSSNVGERIGAILNPRLNRRPASRTMVFTGLILAFALGWFFVAAQVQAEDKPVTPASTVATNRPKPQIELEFKVIAINEATYLSHQKEIDAAVANSDLVSLVTTVNNLPGVSLLSAPSVTTQDGLKANVDITREMHYPTTIGKNKDGTPDLSDFKTKDVGLSIEALPTLTADKKYVMLKFKYTLTSFEGWKEVSPGLKQPIFDRGSIESESLIGEHGYAVWVDGPGTTRAYLPTDNGDNASLATVTSPKRILLFVTARPVPAEAQVASVPSKAMVQISLKYFQISEKTYSQQTATVADAHAMMIALNRGDISYFSRLSDFDLLTEPAILMKVGEQGVLEAVRNIPFPAKLIRDSNGKFIPSDTLTDRLVGMRFVVRPELLADGTISLGCFGEITNFEGWVETNSQEEQPAFNTSRVNGKYGLVTGKPFGTWVRTNFEDQSKLTSWKAGDPPSIRSQDAPKVRIGMIMTAKLYSADGSPIAAP
jgi:hypothetical protein